MASEFKDWDEFAADPIVLPFRGKKYTLPEVSIDKGIRLTQELGKDDSPLAQLGAEDSWRFILEDVYDELKAAGAPVRFVVTAVAVALADFQYGRDAALAVWEDRLDPQKVAAVTPAPTATPDDAA